MSIRNPEQLKEILSDPRRLAKAFSRHSYGMLAWVDLFGDKLKSIKDLDNKLVVTKVIADNAKHAKLFSDRARELGETPETYKPPEIGQRIYDILDTYDNIFDDFAYAWGSLIHFSALLSLYHSVADSQSQHVIEQVEDDVIGQEIRVVNIGLDIFKEALEAQDVKVVQVDWEVPAKGDEKVINVLKKMY